MVQCVEYDGGRVECYRDDSFWYTDVRSFILPFLSTLPLTQQTARPNSQMGHTSQFLRSIPRMVRRRIHPRETEIEERVTAAFVSSCTFTNHPIPLLSWNSC